MRRPLRLINLGQVYGIGGVAYSLLLGHEVSLYKDHILNTHSIWRKNCPLLEANVNSIETLHLTTAGSSTIFQKTTGAGAILTKRHFPSLT
jgi:hypothetical protein